MNDRPMNESKERALTCARCGAAFSCALDGGCWCAAEPYKLPVTTPLTEDCLCPDCLRRAAAAHEKAQNAAR